MGSYQCAQHIACVAEDGVVDHGVVYDGNADDMIAWGESLLRLTVSGTFEGTLQFILPSLLLSLSEVTSSTTTSSFAGGFPPYGNMSTPKYFFRFQSHIFPSSFGSTTNLPH